MHATRTERSRLEATENDKETPEASETVEASETSEAMQQTTDTLTSLLIGMTKSEVQDLRASVHHEDEFAGRVGAVLGEALELAETDPRLRSALGAVTERGVLDVARRQPDKLGDAIAPALGPAIRGMVTLALADLNERVETVIQQSFSLQGLKWRFESYRTGTPLSELVMRDTLTYRVEHALLIHRSSGTLLNHAMQPEYEGKDPAVVAAMLTAVKQFLDEAFESPKASGVEQTGGEELSHQFSAGDSSILIKAGGELALAVVVRGTQTVRLQQLVSSSLQGLLEVYGQQALSFDGNIERYSGSLALLEACLHTEQAKSEEVAEDSAVKAASLTTRYLPVLALLSALAGWWGYQNYTAEQNWQAFLAQLEQQAGVAITRADRVGTNQAIISGLRDPDSVDVAALAEKHGYVDVNWQFQRILSLESAVTIARARRILSPPSGIQLRFGDGVLRLTGRASERWLSDVAKLSVPGVVRIDVSRVLPPAVL